jgi:hypothetical protein
MKTFILIKISRRIPCALALLSLPLILVSCGKPTPAAAAAPKVSAPIAAGENSFAEEDASDQPWYPQAVFLDSPDFKDPFFPHSARRKSETAPSGMVAQRNAAVLSHLSVRAIIGVADPKAWINSRSFSAGEEGEVRLPTGERINIKCLEIKPDSVSVEVEGIPGIKVLPLRLRR